MSCKICGRGACASWMHSAEEQFEHESVEGWDESRLRRELIDARREIKDLKAENDTLRKSSNDEVEPSSDAEQPKV